VKRFIRRIPVPGPAARRTYRSIVKLPPPPAEVPFTTTVDYWEARYQAGGWRLKEHVPNRFPYSGDARTGSLADFFVFDRA
jgi:hypothetical protein